MNVNFTNTRYDENIKQVELVKDIYLGSDTAAKHLNKFPQELEETFNTRKERIALKNYVKRAIEAFVGMIFRKPLDAIGYSDKVLELFKRIDTKSTINQFSREITEKLVRDGVTYVLVDAKTDGSEPYFINIERSSLINWRKDTDGNFTLAVIKEVVDEEVSEFETIEVEQWRVYRDDGNITIYRENESGEYYEYAYIETDFDYIPIVELLLNKVPPMYDIARLNIKHMNRTSAKDRYLDMAACPVPVIWGADVDEENNVNSAKPALVIGVDEAFIFNGTKDEADFQWRELSGSSIDQLQRDLTVIEEEITSGVIRAASSDNQQIKTATQAYYEASEASNRVTVIANVVEYGLNRAVDMLLEALGDKEVGTLAINKDYNALAGSTADLRILWEMYLAGALSIETMLNSMQQFELINIGSSEEEVKRIESDDFKPAPKLDKSASPSMDNNTKALINERNMV